MIWKWDLHFIWNSICTILKPPCFNMEKIKRFWWVCYLEKDIKTTEKQKGCGMCGHGSIKSLLFLKKKKAASAVSTSLFVTRKRKVGSQSSHWPRSKNICWRQEFPAMCRALVLQQCSSPLPSTPGQQQQLLLRALGTEQCIPECSHIWAQLKITPLQPSTALSWLSPPTIVIYVGQKRKLSTFSN